MPSFLSRVWLRKTIKCQAKLKWEGYAIQSGYIKFVAGVCSRLKGWLLTNYRTLTNSVAPPSRQCARPVHGLLD